MRISFAILSLIGLAAGECTETQFTDPATGSCTDCPDGQVAGGNQNEEGFFTECVAAASGSDDTTADDGDVAAVEVSNDRCNELQKVDRTTGRCVDCPLYTRGSSNPGEPSYYCLSEVCDDFNRDVKTFYHGVNGRCI